MNFKLNRRQFISSSGTVFMLPYLESIMAPLNAMALPPPDPRRYVAIYMPDGTYNRSDRPIWYQNTGALNSSNMGEVLSVFSANAADFSVYKNIAMSAADNLSNQIGQHPGEAITFMTMSKNTTPQISLDQIVGQKTGKTVYVINGNPADPGPVDGDNAISYLNGKQVIGFSNPGDMYRDLLGKVVPSTGSSTPRLPASGKSIIDSSMTDLTALKNSLGKSDQPALDQFLSGLRTLETKLASTGGSGAVGVGSCQNPTNDPNVDKTDAATNGSLWLERFQEFNSLISIAFACDVSRSVAMMLYPESAGLTYPSAPSNLRFNGVDIVGWYNHNISHFGHVINSNADYSHESSDGIPRCITRDRYFFSVAVDLMNKLKGINDPSGSRILDNTIMHIQYGVKDGMHYAGNTIAAPLVVAGGKNFMNPGQSYDFSSYDVGDMLYTFNTMLGLGMTNFGGFTKQMKL